MQSFQRKIGTCVFKALSALKALSAFMALYSIHGTSFHSWRFIFPA